jgi:hypothetical protein
LTQGWEVGCDERNAKNATPPQPIARPLPLGGEGVGQTAVDYVVQGLREFYLQMDKLALYTTGRLSPPECRVSGIVRAMLEFSGRYKLGLERLPQGGAGPTDQDMNEEIVGESDRQRYPYR